MPWHALSPKRGPSLFGGDPRTEGEADPSTSDPLKRPELKLSGMPQMLSAVFVPVFVRTFSLFGGTVCQAETA